MDHDHAAMGFWHCNGWRSFKDYRFLLHGWLELGYVPMTPEGKIKQKIRKWIIDNLSAPIWLYWSPGGAFGKAGTPDLLICWRGLLIAIEVKTESGHLTALQTNALKELQSAGAIAAVVRGFDVPRLEAIKQLAEQKASKIYDLN